MRFSRKTVFILAAVFIACLGAGVALFRSAPEPGGAAPEQGESAAAREGEGAADALPRDREREGGNALQKMLALISSFDREQEEEDPGVKFQRLTHSVANDEKIPLEALTPSGYEEGEMEAHRKLLEDIERLGVRVREGRADAGERKRHRELKIMLLERKIAHIRDFMKTMRDFGKKEEGAQDDDIARAMATIEELEQIVASLKEE